MLKNTEEKKADYKAFHVFHWVLLFVVLASATMLVNWNASDFRASVIPTKSAAPFDGTATPILKVPKWTALTSTEYKLPYDQIPTDKFMPFPKYDASVLKTPTENLGWKTEQDLTIRNQKITFSTPYMGNYKLDGVEYGGSHLAVDIKVPMGTPVYAIANGTVVKVTEQDTGFGKHIVVKHENAPSLNDASVKETLYSSYNHLSSILVTEGDVVTKGQQIAKSGDTGTASTPHLHFQIDNSNAPWHPYWPFTYQEASAAGLTFNGAVDAGLGKDKAIQSTVNPVMYVQKYLSGVTTSTTNSTSTTTTTTTTTTTPPVTNPTTTSELPPSTITTTTTETTTPVVTSTEEVVTVPDKIATQLEVKMDTTLVKDVPMTVNVKALDENGNLVTTYKPKQGLYPVIEVGNADVPFEISPDQVLNGSVEFQITPTAALGLQIKVTDNEISGVSNIATNKLFTDVASADKSYRAVNFLKDHDVISGYPDGTFKPANVVSRVEALKFILMGVNSNLLSTNTLPFKDTAVTEWYSEYVATGYNKQIIDGYPDKTFKPANTVNRAEFLKMLLTAMNVEVDPIITRDVYADVPKEAWFAPYVQYSKDTNLVAINGNEFRPEEGMTRAEVAETIYRMIVLKVSGARKYSSGVTISEGSVSQYFS